MRASYWRISAVAVLMAGTLGGCGGESVEQLEAQVQEATNKRNATKMEFRQIQSEMVGCEDSTRVFKLTSDGRIEELKKENADLKAQLAQKK
ncbi:MAG: hypothetical protein ACRERD_09030 [Candidatus Binatia bacterium]